MRFLLLTFLSNKFLYETRHELRLIWYLKPPRVSGHFIWVYHFGYKKRPTSFECKFWKPSVQEQKLNLNSKRIKNAGVYSFVTSGINKFYRIFAMLSKHFKLYQKYLVPHLFIKQKYFIFWNNTRTKTYEIWKTQTVNIFF